MNKYYRMVIDLYKESLTDKMNQANEKISLEVLTEIAKAITTAKIENKPTVELEALMTDVQQLRLEIV